MNERSFEILVRQCAEVIFCSGWQLIAQQLSLSSGRLDLLFLDAESQRHVVELKKGRAKLDAITQTVRYAEELSNLLDGAVVVPWLVAHEIPVNVRAHASQLGVRTRAVSNAECEVLMKSSGLGERELFGVRRAEGVLHGGAGRGGIWGKVDNDVAYSSLPQEMASVLRDLEKRKNFLVRSGAMQTVVHYRGVKLGGVNRVHRGGHGYISEGVVLGGEFSMLLENLGFRRMTKTQSGNSHEHIWWEISAISAGEFECAINAARDVVNRSLEIG